MENNLIYLARFTVEAATPMALGSGEKGLIVDRLIARDANGLPYIPGSSIAGVIRHELDPEDNKPLIKNLFGFQEKQRSSNDEDNNLGSRVFFSSGMLLAEDGQKVHETLELIDFTEGFYSHFKKLPERDHVRITHKGAAATESHGKFDEEVVHKGTRFVFEIELLGNSNDKDLWESILSTVHQPFFRIGGGTRNGFGKLKVIECLTKKHDLNNEDQLLEYLNRNNSLNNDCSKWERFEAKENDLDNYIHYEVHLQPESYFHFGAGFGDEDVDMKPKTEPYFEWGSNGVQLKKDNILIPATSVKGALSHRVAFHYNRLTQKDLCTSSEMSANRLPQIDLDDLMNQHLESITNNQIPDDSEDPAWKSIEDRINAVKIDTLLELNYWKEFNRKLPNLDKVTSSDTLLPIGENNDAVKQLFGSGKEDAEGKVGGRGKVILSDLYLTENQVGKKAFSHVMIDRYTGGALDGALYQEKVVNSNDFKLDIFIEKTALTNDKVKQAFEATLEDLVQGRLQLGGNTTKGHGAFLGTFKTK